MSNFNISTGCILLLATLFSCSTPTIKQEKKEQPTHVKVIALQKEDKTIHSTFIGEIKFGKQTTFNAQQPGIVSLLKVSPGQRVSKNEIIVTFPPVHHELQIEQARIEYNKTRKDYEKQLELVKIGAVPSNNLSDFKAQLEVQAKAIEQLETINTLKAPFDGIITQVFVKQGQEIGVESPLFSIAQTQNIEIEFYVGQHAIEQVKIGTNAQFTLENTLYNGRVIKKSIQIDPQRKAFLVTASFPASNITYAGSSVNIDVETENLLNSIWIPTSAIRFQGRSPFVYIKQGNKAIKRKISLGKRTESTIQIIKGISNKDQLIVAGIDKLEDQAHIILSKK